MALGEAGAFGSRPPVFTSPTGIRMRGIGSLSIVGPQIRSPVSRFAIFLPLGFRVQPIGS